MPQGTKISFIVFPDGKIDEKSLTVSGETMAKQRCVNEWPPSHYFGDSITGYALDRLWQNMSERGFKCYTISMDDGQPVLDRD